MLALREMKIDLPAGYTVRPATMDDLETAFTFFNLCAHEMIGHDEIQLINLRGEWEDPRLDLARSTRTIWKPDGEMVGYVEFWDTNALPVKPWVWWRVHPEEDIARLGAYLLDWAEERSQETLPRLPEDVKFALRTGAVSTYHPMKDLLHELDWQMVRHFWNMEIGLNEAPPPPVWPEGITVKTLADVGDLTAVYRATQESFADHWGFVPQPEEDGVKQWQHWTESDPTFDPTFWLLAMDGDEIAGVSLCRKESYEDPEMGYVNTLGVRRPWRRQGLALALLHHSFGLFYRHGKKRAGLGVDADSLTGATRLYEKAGMHISHQFDSYEKEMRPGRDISKQTLEE